MSGEGCSRANEFEGALRVLADVAAQYMDTGRGDLDGALEVAHRVLAAQRLTRPLRRVVWKYPVRVPDEHGRAWVDLPDNAVPLSVGLQGDDMVLWALVDPYAKSTAGLDRLLAVNTGTEIPEFPNGSRFLGTITTENGIVWHVFDGDAETKR
jgi:hypothetical protein